MAWLGIIFIVILSTWLRKITQFIEFGSILLLLPYTQREKNIWNELESNPSPLASRATALTSRPWLLEINQTYNLLNIQEEKGRGRMKDVRQEPCVCYIWWK